MSTDLASSRIARAIAPAKINPWLEVLGRRPDGYHEIRTWMIALDLCDRITARADDSGEIRLDVTGPCASADIPRDRSNLCWRAAAEVLKLAQRTHVARARFGVELSLEKNIPSQAGMGGASADAAATWLAVASALELDPDSSISSSALASLGSDCVFFLEAASTGTGWCEGRGERVTVGPRVEASWFVALLTPSVQSPTRSVYAAFRKHLRAPGGPHSLPSSWFEMPASAIRRFFFNELEPVALEAVPALVPWRETLDECESEHFRLSGSGSSFYGLFDNRDEAQSTLDRIVAAAHARGLRERGRWVARPAGFGAKLGAAEHSEER
jgi:4-diphosphocytidyl-2-C-methyl-D-erythritol kinase